MKKISIFFLLSVLCTTMSFAGTWVVGVNHIDQFLSKVEQGTGEAPPAFPKKEDGSFNTDYEGVWNVFPGITCTTTDITTNYLNHADANNHWRGIVSVNYAGAGFVQKAETSIEFVQPSLVDFDYSGVPEGYNSLVDYWDRHDLSWLELIDLSGNDLHTVVIDAGPYNEMPVKTINLSNNPRLSSVSILKCTQLETVNLSGTAISQADYEVIRAAILEASPTANIIYTSTSIDYNKTEGYAQIELKGRTIYINNKNANDVVTLYDISGSKKIETSDDVVNTDKLNKGVYMIKVNNKVKKVVLN